MILMTSERAWSLAMCLKQQAYTEPRKRHHMVEKMRKAVLHSVELDQLCGESTKVDGRTKLEAQVSTLLVYFKISSKLLETTMQRLIISVKQRVFLENICFY